MTSFNKKFFTVIIIIIAAIGCERVEFDPKIDNLNKKLPVVYAVIGDHPDFRTIELSRTAPYMDGSEIEKIENATVTVSDPQNNYAFEPAGDGLYEAPENFTPEVGTTYNLKIDLDGEIYEAHSKMTPAINMHSPKVHPDRWEESDAGIYEITAWIKDNEMEDECFLFKYAVNGEMYDSVNVWGHYNDELTNNTWLEDTQIFGNIEAEEDDTIDVYVLSISTEYYDFIQAAEKNRISFNPFTPPAGVPITGNISNEALGIFQVTAIEHDSVTVKDLN